MEHFTAETAVPEEQGPRELQMWSAQSTDVWRWGSCWDTLLLSVAISSQAVAAAAAVGVHRFARGAVLGLACCLLEPKMLGLLAGLAKGSLQRLLPTEG